MTSRPALGIHRPPPRNHYAGASLPPNRSLQSPHARVTPGSRLQDSIDLTIDTAPSAISLTPTSSLADARTKSEPSPNKSWGQRRDSPMARNEISMAPSERYQVRGKPFTSFDDVNESVAGEAPSENNGINATELEISVAPPPLPAPFKTEPRSSSSQIRSPTHTHPTHEMAAKPYALEPPQAAPLLSPENHADFFPWSGSHPEDSLSENTIRQGFFDKPHTSQSEYQSARGLLWPSLKHKTGLHTLSTVFVQIMDQRRSQGRITAPSTFKPPPRVTLTDTKREAWLRDLANSSVPLRRLSRTIPHGIRGKVLLEQCLSKNIPTGRAVWLAKCVGANEMRAVKRKGANVPFAMGNEAKWVRDWTVFVEQFLESVIGSVGNPDWTARMTYAIRLSAHLFSEHLLDQEHYMSWVISSFEKASLDTLPVWLLNLRIYWKPLARCRKFGRRLVPSLFDKIELAKSSEKHDTSEDALKYMWALATDLIYGSPENLVNPTFWARHSPALAKRHDVFRPSAQDRLKTIKERNEKLTSQIMERNPTAVRARELYELLDTLPPHTPPKELSDQVLEILRNPRLIFQILFRWASSPHRTGISRVYTAVRLTRKLKKDHFLDTDEHILTAISTVIDESCDQSNIYLLMSELVRSNDFAVGAYLQWLIARGTLSRPGELENPSCEVCLLTQLPLTGLSPRLVNLRRLLLSNLGFPILQEAVHTQQLYLQMQLLSPELFGSNDSAEEIMPGFRPETLSEMSRTHKSALGRWIRQCVGERVTGGDPVGPNNWKDLSVEAGISAITATQFDLVRAALEQIQDFSILADVLKLVSTSDNPVVLASAADTLSHHLEVFAAVGALEDCFKRLYERCQLLEVRKVTDKCLLSSLKDLAAAIPTATPAYHQLTFKLSQCNQRSSVVVSSPVSDHTSDMLQSADADFGDEVDKFLSTGTSIDKHTLKRYFEVVTTRIQSTPESASKSHTLGYSISLARLRSFDHKGFDSLMQAWLKAILSTKQGVPLGQMWASLVVAGCLDIASVVSCLLEVAEANVMSHEHAILREAALEALQFLVRQDNHVHQPLDYDSYRFRLQQEKYAKEHGMDVLAVARITLDTLSTEISKKAMELLTETSLSRSVVNALVHRRAEVCKWIISIDPKAGQAVLINLERVVDSLLQIPSSEGNDNLSLLPIHAMLTNDAKEFEDNIAGEFENMLDLTDELSFPLCQIKLTLMFRSVGHAVAGMEKTDTDNLAGSLLEAIEMCPPQAIAVPESTWMELIPELEENVASLLCHKAEIALLNALKSSTPLHLSSLPKFETLKKSESTLGKYLTVVEVCAANFPGILSVVAPTLLIDGLEILVQYLHPDEMNGDTDGLRPMWQRNEVFMLWSTILLRLLAIQGPAFANPKLCSSANQTRILTALCTVLLYQHHLDETKLLPELLVRQVFDMTAWLADGFAPDAIVQVHGRLVQAASYIKSPPVGQPPGQAPLSTYNPPGGPAQPTPLPTNSLSTQLLYLLNLTSLSLTTIAPLYSPGGYWKNELLQSHKTPHAPHANPTHPAAAAGASARRLATTAATFHAPFPLRHWEILSEPTPMMMGENDTSLSLTLFRTFKNT
ncbi:MAG: hypothetical protein M4579_004716 [Chaenotheca gracillima]|nr:MAG: hypothetical protein M4579_004716 [Chaenotheca gracillima]